eukprot:TRINITY_DN104315_c0_g1_i1.p1 TRINITY_DN104315_c0_g1~~TRINITY_DN104315_c0_g1_i1.p1  ORF type:complete len:229 (-),score=84.17 TRINITY_DN104315_c0_g1_i1:50-736(-)
MAYVKVKSRRLKDTIVAKPFIYGTAAFSLPHKERTEERTHRWYVYVRGVEHEDLSYFIKKVTFQLHPSLKNPVQTVEKAPFQIMEYGWGEFEILIKVHFHDTRQPAITLSHHLQLHPPPNVSESTRRPVVSEKYDEFVFVDPLESFHKLLVEGPKGDKIKVELTPHFTTNLFVQQEQEHLAQLNEAQLAVNRSVDLLRKQLADTEAAIAHYKQFTGRRKSRKKSSSGD